MKQRKKLPLAAKNLSRSGVLLFISLIQMVFLFVLFLLSFDLDSFMHSDFDSDITMTCFTLKQPLLVKTQWTFCPDLSLELADRPHI